MKCIIDADSPSHKLLILSDKYTDQSCLPELVSDFLHTNNMLETGESKEGDVMVNYSLKLNYDDMDAYSVLKAILPKDMDGTLNI